MKISNHAKIRMKERLSLKHRERRQLFRLALKKGKCIQQIKDKRTHDYLVSKQRYNSQIRLYNDYVFVYSRNSHQLYTMYKLPDYLKKGENND